MTITLSKSVSYIVNTSKYTFIPANHIGVFISVTS